MKLRWVVLYGLGALFTAVVLWVAVTSFSRRVKVINIADYDHSSRELRLASAMPSCGCLTITRKFSPTLGDRVRRGFDWLRRFGASATERRPFELRVRLNGRGNEIGKIALNVLTDREAKAELGRITKEIKEALDKQAKGVLDDQGKKDLAELEKALAGVNETLTFAFDWAGADIDDFYEVKVYDSANETVDFGARFDLSAEPGQPCDGTVCSFKLPGLDRGLNATVGQNDVRSAFAGATTARGDRAIEVVASPPVPVTPSTSAPATPSPSALVTPSSQPEVTGGCGCLLLQVLEDVTLKARLKETSRGYLTLSKGKLETIAFDHGSPAGDRYVITAEDDSRPITDFVRIVGHLDRMGCTHDWAVFEPGTLVAGAENQPTPPAAAGASGSNSNDASGKSQTANQQGEKTAPPEDRSAEVVRVLDRVSCPYQHPRGNMRLLAMVPSASSPDLQSQPPTGAETGTPRGK